MHDGVDIRAKMGSPIQANISGKVIASGDAVKNGYNASYGNIVVIQDANGYKHMYAHLSKTNVKVGSTINAGSVAGLAGDTGRTTAAHLHYEVSLNGKSVNPNQFFG